MIVLHCAIAEKQNKKCADMSFGEMEKFSLFKKMKSEFR